MAGSKFQYDESGGTFFYFLLAFLALLVLPSTYYLWPKEEKEKKTKDTKKCRCEACELKASRLKVTHPWQKTKQNITRILILLGWIALAACAYKVANMEDSTYVKWDPYEILEIDPGSGTAEVKKAYRKLSLIYHPDRETGDEKRFMMIAKAYAALTDEEARKNWEEYGNPDGPGAMSFGIALPSWIVEKEYSFFVLGAYALVFMIALPVVVGMWWYRSAKYGEDLELLLETSHIFIYFINKSSGLMTMRRLIMIFCSAFDFEKARNPEIIQRPTDEVEVPALIKKIPEFGEKNRERPLCFEYSLKARSLLYAHLLRIPLSDGLREDQAYVLKKFPALIQEFVNCCSQITMLAFCGRLPRYPKTETLENAMKLCQLVVQAQWEPRSSLTQLPHVTEDLLKTANKKMHIRNINQVREMTESRRRELFRFLDDNQYEDVIRVLRQMPAIEVSVKVEVLDDEDHDKITADAMVTLTATLTRKRPEEVLNMEDDARSIKSELKAIENTSEAVSANGGVGHEGEGGADGEDGGKGNPAAPKPKAWQKNKPGKKGGGKAGKGKKKVPQKVVKVVKAATTATAAPQQNSAVDGKGDGNAESSRVNSSDEEEVHHSEPSTDAKGEEHTEDDGETEGNATASGKSSSAVKASGGGGGSETNNEHDEDDDDWQEMKMPKKSKDNLEKKSKQSHSVHCPYFPLDKQEFWWVYLVDKKSRSLMTVPFLVTNLVDQEDAILKFTAPSKPGTYQYVLHVRSDSYYQDFDVTQQVKFDVHEAKQFVTPVQWADVDEDSEADELGGSEESAVTDSDLADYSTDEEYERKGGFDDDDSD